MNRRRQKPWVSHLHGKGLLEREDPECKGQGAKVCVRGGGFLKRKAHGVQGQGRTRNCCSLGTSKAVFNDVPDLAEPSGKTSAVQESQAEFD